MTETLFSPSWYRVAGLTPRLRGHTRIYRHLYRGEVWYVLQDHSKGSYYRFSPTAFHVVGLMDGRRTVQKLWELTTDRFGDDGPTQQEVVQLLAQLHGADVLLCNVPPDTVELLERAEKVSRAKRLQNLRSPLAIRIPLIDPERFLAATVALVRPLFSVGGVLLWLAVVATAGVLVTQNWPELTRDIVDRVLSAQNLLAIYLIYPLVKALHELGHGYAVKVWGGEVHEVGIMFLVFMPIPYVDASAASEFRARYRRVLVGAMGIIVELFLASVAMMAWVALEPGAWRSLVYNIVLIGGVSTIFFNANPLLRFDGYYILSDLLEIPNMAQRALNYLGYFCKKYLFGIRDVPEPATGPGEPFWFLAYSLATFIYRLFIYTGIILFVAGKFFFIGILLALWSVGNMLVVPLSKGVKFLASSPLLQEKRRRAVLLSGAGVAAVAILLFAVPFPSWTRTEGVVWAPEESLVRAGTSGFVSRIVAEPGSEVDRGDVLVECRDPLLVSKVAVLRAQLAEIETRYDAAVATDQVQARILQEEIDGARKALERSEERLAELTIRSPARGQFVLQAAQDLPDRYLHQGDVVGWVLDLHRPTIRVVVPQSSVDLVRRRTEGVEVRMVERIDRILPAVVRREVPEAGEHLPSPTLGSAGGGEIAIDPFEASGRKTFERLFEFDLELMAPIDRAFVGGRVYVRFDHGYEPIATRAFRAVRRLFLRRLNV